MRHSLSTHSSAQTAFASPLPPVPKRPPVLVRALQARLWKEEAKRLRDEIAFSQAQWYRDESLQGRLQEEITALREECSQQRGARERAEREVDRLRQQLHEMSIEQKARGRKATTPTHPPLLLLAEFDECVSALVECPVARSFVLSSTPLAALVCLPRRLMERRWARQVKAALKEVDRQPLSHEVDRD